MVLSQIKKPQVYLVTINIVKALSTYVEFNEGSFSFHVNVGRQRVQVPFKTNPQNTKGVVVYLNYAKQLQDHFQELYVQISFQMQHTFTQCLPRVNGFNHLYTAVCEIAISLPFI